MKTLLKYVATGLVVLLAAGLVFLRYREFLVNPWTRDGQVRADVVQIAPRVSGPIVTLNIRDNQLVKAGDILFAIDRRTFEAAYEQAKATLDRSRDQYDAGIQQVEAAKAQVEMARFSILQAESAVRELNARIEKSRAEYTRQQELLPQKATSQKAVEWSKASYESSLAQKKGAEAALAEAHATLNKAEAAYAEVKASVGEIGKNNAAVRQAQAALRQAELNLEFATVKAPVSGYVTNLNLRLGSNVVANQPALALVDVKSYWVQGFFKETQIGAVQPGDEAVVTLMTYPDRPLQGRVDSLGWGISQQNGSTGFDLLPNVSPTFEWIRLAQRVPVRIVLDSVPEDIKLRVGTTASVLIRTGAGNRGDGGGK